MNRFEEIDTFVRTVEAGTFTAAAEQLGVAKSLVSRRIRDLEERLGVQLFTRTTRQLRLTAEGQALHDRATVLMADWLDMEAVGGSSVAALTGRIRVSLPLSFGLMQVGPALTRFSADNPDVHCDLQFSDRKVDLIGEGFDLALRIANIPDSSLKARKLASLSACAVASPDFIARHGKPASLAQLSELPALRYTLRERKRWDVFDPAGVEHQFEPQAVLSADNGEFLRDAAVAGLGFIVLPHFIVRQALADGSLVELLEDHRWPGVDLYAVYPATRHLPARVRALIDYLASHCAGD